MTRILVILNACSEKLLNQIKSTEFSLKFRINILILSWKFFKLIILLIIFNIILSILF